ncbi:unnamed protein product, partial [Adineta steineri]
RHLKLKTDEIINPSDSYISIESILVAYLNVAIPLELGNLINAVSSILTNSSSSIDIKQMLSKPTYKLIELYIYQSIATFEYITLLSIAGERMAAG